MPEEIPGDSPLLGEKGEKRSEKQDKTNPSAHAPSHAPLRGMITRQWVLAVLWELPLYWWPVFFWELHALKGWLDTRPVEEGAFLIFGVTPKGQIMLDGYYPPAKPGPTDWTRYAPRQPWAKLGPAARPAPVLEAGLASAAHDTVLIPSRYPSGGLKPSEPLAPP